MKISTLTIKFNYQDFGFKDKPRGSDIFGYGPYFQGLLMEYIDTNVAEALHQGGTNPYSMGVLVSDDNISWHLKTTGEYRNKLISPFMDKATDNLYIKALGKNLKIIEKQEKEVDIDFGKLFYSDENMEKFTIRFLTPTAFKQAGKYVFTPNLRLILGSLARKYDAIIDKNDGDVEEDLLDSLTNASYITSYRLSTTYTKMERVNIPGMTGSLTFKVRGTNTLKNYINMLLEFGSYFGVGIKNSMGMGMMERRDGR
jgi:CRISPR-associated endoribonuclease Cas6